MSAGSSLLDDSATYDPLAEGRTLAAPRRVWGGGLVDRITKSLLDEFSKDFGLQRLDEDDRFEHFATYVTVHRQHSETFDTSEIVLSESGGMGIDAIAVLINGSLVLDLDTFNDFADDVGYLDVTFILFRLIEDQTLRWARSGISGSLWWIFLRKPRTYPGARKSGRRPR